MTEQAANKIMDAANDIGEIIGKTHNFNETKRSETLEKIQNQLNEIYGIVLLRYYGATHP